MIIGYLPVACRCELSVNGCMSLYFSPVINCQHARMYNAGIGSTPTLLHWIRNRKLTDGWKFSTWLLWAVLCLLHAQVLYQRPGILRVVHRILAVPRTVLLCKDISDVLPGISLLTSSWGFCQPGFLNSTAALQNLSLIGHLHLDLWVTRYLSSPVLSHLWKRQAPIVTLGLLANT